MTAYSLTDGKWKKYVNLNNTTEDSVENFVWIHCSILEVSLHALCNEYEALLDELSEKEADLIRIDEKYKEKEFNILFIEDINFKELYGKANDKTRAHHVKIVCKDLRDQKHDLELSINWLKRYIPFLRTIIRSKINDQQEHTETEETARDQNDYNTQ